MRKINLFSMGALATGLMALAESVTIDSGKETERPVQKKRRRRNLGRAKRRYRSSKYTPRPTKVRNIAIVQNGQWMHARWKEKHFPSTVNKPDPHPRSVSSIKKKHGCHRHKARLISARG